MDVCMHFYRDIVDEDDGSRYRLTCKDCGASGTVARCIATNKDDTHCRRFAAAGSDYCKTHDESLVFS